MHGGRIWDFFDVDPQMGVQQTEVIEREGANSWRTVNRSAERAFFVALLGPETRLDATQRPDQFFQGCGLHGYIEPSQAKCVPHIVARREAFDTRSVYTHW